jgi:peptide/nickel transport system substrate-binding protein/oligopeptide transport system substrate-binding protein
VRIDQNYETLPGSGCAESWEVAEDGLTWTFHIYPGLEWSDGTPFTAHDIEWSCKRQADPETGYESPFNFYQIKNFEESILGEVSPDEVGCEAIDDTTFQVVTEKPLPFLPLMLGEMWFAPRHVVEEVGETWSLSPETFVGNGPYTLEEWDRGNRLVFKRNTNYKGPMKPYLEKIIFKIAEPEAMFPAYLAGDNEAIVREYKTYLSPADKKRMETDPELSKELHQFNRMQTYWIAFGEKDCVFKDPKVRQAFMHGVTDREGIIASALGGMGTPGYGMLPSGFHCADQERLKDIQAYDPELAKELLAEAGYPNGEGFPELDLYLRDEPPTTVAAAEAIAALAKANLGVTLSVSNLEKKTYIDKMFADEMCIYLIPWGMDYYDAFNFIQIYSTGFRHPWSNEEYDNLFNAANTEFDPEKRCELYQEAEEILVSEPGAIFMWYPVVRQTWKTYIKGPGVEPNKYGDRLWQDPKHGQTYFQVYIAEH